MNATQQTENTPPRHVLFLDGECAFCQRSSQVLHRLDRGGQLYFATLQGETAEVLPEKWRSLTDTDGKASGAAILVEHFDSEHRYWRGADAILRSLKLAGGIVSLAWIFHFIPRPIKAAIYNAIAQRRHKLAKTECPVPSEAFRKKLLP